MEQQQQHDTLHKAQVNHHMITFMCIHSSMSLSWIPLQLLWKEFHVEVESYCLIIDGKITKDENDKCDESKLEQISKVSTQQVMIFIGQ